MNSPATLTENRSIRIVLVDDQLLFRAGMKSLISRSTGMTVVGDAGTRAEALAVVQREQPDIVLLDLRLQGQSVIDFLPELVAAAENTKIVLLTSTRDPEVQHKAVRMGAKGLLSKDSSFDMVAKAIARVHEGEAWLDHSMTAMVLDELVRRREAKKLNPEEAKIAALTAREREVISAVGEGLKNKQIGKRLFISDVTVHHHLTSIYSKLDVSDRLELIIYAYRHGLASIPR